MAKLWLTTLALVAKLFLAATQLAAQETPPTAPEPVREIVVFTAEWCGPCQPVKAAAKDLPYVRFLDIDKEPEEAAKLWAGKPLGAFGKTADGRPAAIPAYALLVDGEVVMRWGHPGRVPDFESLLAFNEPTVEPKEEPGLSTPAPIVSNPPIVPDANAPAWAARIQIDGGGATATGSGVVFGKRGNEYLVLTNAHVVRAIPGGMCRVKVAGAWRDARVLVSEGRPDLAAIGFNSEQELAVMPVADVAPPDGSAVEMHGFAAGVVYHSVTTTISRSNRPATAYLGARSCSGMSGGPVVAGGKLVGLIYGADVVYTDPDAGAGLCVDHASIVAFLARNRLATP
jgi:hypothetical protein